MAFESKSDAITVTLSEGYSGGTRQSAVPRGWEPGHGAVATAQVKGAKDLLGGSRVKRRGQTERHFRNRVNNMKGLTGCAQCLEMLLTERTMAQDGVKMPK